MPVTFSAADNLDGTVTITVAGSGAGDTNEVRTAPIDNQWGDEPTWTSRGSRTGNGAVSFSLAAGVYFVAVISAGTWTVPQSCQVRGESQAQLEWLLQSAQARCRLMTLPGILTANINAYLTIDVISVRNMTARSLWIAPVNSERLQAAGVPVGLDGIVYPILVGISDPANRAQTNREDLLYCRETIRRGLLNQRLTTQLGTAAWSGFVAGYQPLEIVDRTWWIANAFVSAQIFLVQVNEERGLV